LGTDELPPASGSGFQPKWGGWLANEAFEYLLGCPQIDPGIGQLLWKHRRSGGFEAAEPEAAPTLSMALKAGGPVDAPAGGIAADSLAPRRIGSLVYPIAKRHVDRVVLVPDEAINRAQLALWETLRVVAEPGGAAAFAALVSGRYKPRPGEHVGILLSGGNTTAVNFA
jgi:threonine dehydratase